MTGAVVAVAKREEDAWTLPEGRRAGRGGHGGAGDNNVAMAARPQSPAPLDDPSTIRDESVKHHNPIMPLTAEDVVGVLQGALASCFETRFYSYDVDK